MTIGLEVRVPFSVACSDIPSIPGYGGTDFGPSFPASINGGMGAKLGAIYPGSTKTDTAVSAGACTDAETRHRRSGSSEQIYVIIAVLSYPSATLAAQDMSASRSTSGLAALQNALATAVNDAIVVTGLTGSVQPVTADAVSVTPATLSQEEADKSTDLTFLWVGLTFFVALVIVVVTLYLKWRHRQRLMRIHDLSLQIENPQAWLKKRLNDNDPFQTTKVQIAAFPKAPAFPSPHDAKKDVFSKATVREDPFEVLKKARLDFFATSAKDKTLKRNKVGPATVTPKLNKTSEARAAFHKSKRDGTLKFSASGAVLQVKAGSVAGLNPATTESADRQDSDSAMWNRMSGMRGMSGTGPRRKSWAVRRAALESMKARGQGIENPNVRVKPAPFFPEKPSVGKRHVAIAPPPPARTVRADNAAVNGADFLSATLDLDKEYRDIHIKNERRLGRQRSNIEDEISFRLKSSSKRGTRGVDTSPHREQSDARDYIRDASLAQLARERASQAASPHTSSPSDARRSVALDDTRSPPLSPRGAATLDDPVPEVFLETTPVDGNANAAAADGSDDGSVVGYATAPFPGRLRRQSTVLSDNGDDVEA